MKEYDAKIEYIKCKENKIGNFQSRIDINTSEINLFENYNSTSLNSVHVDINESLATIHSQEENLVQHILEIDVNRSKTQIIFGEQRDKDLEIIFNKKRIYIERNDIPNNVSNIILSSDSIIIGKTGIIFRTERPFLQ